MQSLDICRVWTSAECWSMQSWDLCRAWTYAKLRPVQSGNLCRAGTCAYWGPVQNRDVQSGGMYSRVRWKIKNQFKISGWMYSYVKLNFKHILFPSLNWCKHFLTTKITLLVLLRKYKGNCPRFLFFILSLPGAFKVKMSLNGPPIIRGQLWGVN